jgi:hypothetical protein
LSFDVLQLIFGNLGSLSYWVRRCGLIAAVWVFARNGKWIGNFIAEAHQLTFSVVTVVALL